MISSCFTVRLIETYWILLAHSRSKTASFRSRRGNLFTAYPAEDRHLDRIKIKMICECFESKWKFFQNLFLNAGGLALELIGRGLVALKFLCLVCLRNPHFGCLNLLLSVSRSLALGRLTCSYHSGIAGHLFASWPRTRSGFTQAWLPTNRLIASNAVKQFSFFTFPSPISLFDHSLF